MVRTMQCSTWQWYTAKEYVAGWAEIRGPFLGIAPKCLSCKGMVPSRQPSVKPPHRTRYTCHVRGSLVAMGTEWR